ncbi:MAG: MlaA family lipoprotein [Burkholderiales bacterium]
MSSACQRLSLRFAAIVLLMSFLGGCATGTNPRDPLEPFNRGVYQFNETLDKVIFKPVAQGYRAVLPQFVRSSNSNFFSNINDVVVLFNNLLQGKFTSAVSDFGRIAINSTIGVLGLFDVASEAGIEKHDEDFGQTLAVWGVHDGPFIMLPFFGPSTGRDAVGRIGDYFTDPVSYIDPNHTRNQLWGTRVVNRRAELLDASTILETAALDPYEFVRDAYLQRRRNLIYDGAPPTEKDLEPGTNQKGAASLSVAAVPANVRPDIAALPHTETFARSLMPSPSEPLAFALPPPGPSPSVPETAPSMSLATPIAASVDISNPAPDSLAQARAPRPVSTQRSTAEPPFFVRLWRLLFETGPRDALHGS